MAITMVFHSLWLCPSNNPTLILLSDNCMFKRVILNQNQNQTKCSLSDDKNDFSSSSYGMDFVLLGGLTSLSLTTCVPFFCKFLFLAFVASSFIMCY